MRNKVIMFITCAFLMGCNGQKEQRDEKSINSREDNPILKIVMENNLTKKNVSKKLNSTYLYKIKEFDNKNKETQFTENDTVVRLRDRGDAFVESRRKNNEKLEKRFAYDKNSNSLLSTGTFFYEIPIGLHEQYNREGKLIRERNYDESFPFSVLDLIQKIKETHHIDLNNTTKVTRLRREFCTSCNMYIYVLAYISNEKKERQMLINGETGEILKEVNLEDLEYID